MDQLDLQDLIARLEVAETIIRAQEARLAELEKFRADVERSIRIHKEGE